jgi:hypothetical protein
LKLQHLLLLTLALTACRTTDKHASSPSDAGSTAFAASPEDCDEVVLCSMDYAPVHCRVERAGMPPSFTLHAWASNACKGKSDLRRRACKAGWDKEERDRISCEDAPAKGTCPPSNIVCPPSDAPAVPTLCLSGQYAGKPRVGDDEVRGYGPDACSAKAAMLSEACRRGLDPSQLESVSCSGDPTAGECIAPLDPPDCRETMQRLARCTVTRALGVTLETPIVGDGPSACAAKRWLVYKACQRGLKPSALEEVICRFEK